MFEKDARTFCSTRPLKLYQCTATLSQGLGLAAVVFRASLPFLRRLFLVHPSRKVLDGEDSCEGVQAYSNLRELVGFG